MSDTIPVFSANQRFQIMNSPTAETMRLQNKRGRVIEHYFGRRYLVQIDSEAHRRILDACIMNPITAEDEARWEKNTRDAKESPRGA